jgi:hypothetical protein
VAVTLTIRLPERSLPSNTATVLCEQLSDWDISGINSADVADLCPSSLSLLQLADALEQNNFSIRWQSTFATDIPCDDQAQDWVHSAYRWPVEPTILALIPHWRCEPWLRQCLASLLHQTHALTNIVVIDDASEPPPLEIVRDFSQVTLLTAPARVGPYRLIQSVIDQTDYCAYLFQDADDWSSCDRLQTLLNTARANGAELVGSQEIRVLEAEQQFQAVGYPAAVNLALSQALGHALLHPTSLVTRSLVQRIGGFATGLTFGGDTEFLLRAHWTARIANTPHYCYFRRKRSHSLTTDATTGLDSPARKALTELIKQRARNIAQAAAHRQPLDLSPLSVAPQVQLTHCWGPPLRWI